ncbi:hypothetical protein BGZ94_007747 [Podila epigama]|nr:hypothetical protein BGZ94_007747 [Podila epigama]
MPIDSTLSQVGNSLATSLARYPALAVGLPLVGGFLSALPLRPYVKEEYKRFDKPAWAPPASLFAPAWTTLYITIGYASHLVALHTGPLSAPAIRNAAKTGLVLYGVNLGTAIAMSKNYFRVDKTAGYLTLPYIAWLCYANALNFDVWIKHGKGPAADKARRLSQGAKDVAHDAKGAAKDVKRSAEHAAHDVKASANKHLNH